MTSNLNPCCIDVQYRVELCVGSSDRCCQVFPMLVHCKVASCSDITDHCLAKNPQSVSSPCFRFRCIRGTYNRACFELMLMTLA